MPSKFVLPKNTDLRKLVLSTDMPEPVTIDRLLEELGEPSAYDDEQYRWGNRQSLLVDIKDGVATAWWSYEHNEGGQNVQQLIDYKEKYVAQVVPFSGDLAAKPRIEKWSQGEILELFWWKAEAIRLDGSSVAPYLRSRGISPDIPQELVRQGIHRSNKGANPFPALMVPLTDERGTVLAIQAIRVPGGKKLDYVPKVTQGRAKGAAFRLPGEGKPVVVEGPEDALSIWQATGRPVLATCGKGNLKNLDLGGQDITIWFDNDVTPEDIEDIVENVKANSINGVMSDEYKDANAALVAGADIKEILRGAVTLTPGKPEGDWDHVDLNDLAVEDLPPTEWLIPDFVKARSANSMAGASNAGKTNWTALFVIACASGRTDLIGREKCEPFPVAWVSNEESTLDLKAKLQAAMLHYGIKAECPVVLRGNEHEQLILVEKRTYEVEVNKQALADLEKHAEGCKLLIFDPFNTLQLGLDPNVGAGEINKALRDVASSIGAATLHIHHTPKERGKDDDWYVGTDVTAWMGATQIYSTLDTGIIFSRWLPQAKQDREMWKALDPLETRRWVQTSQGKARGFLGFEPQMYRIETYTLSNGQSHPVMVPVTEEQARDVLRGEVEQVTALINVKLKSAIDGDEMKLSEIHKIMKGTYGWPNADKLQKQVIDVIEGKLEGTDYRLHRVEKTSKNHFNKVVKR